MPAHTHPVMANGQNATTDKPSNTVMLAGSGTATTLYTKIDPADTKKTAFTFDEDAVAISGSGQPHNNVMPSMGINFIICVNGLFPQRP